jgi:hypothetical protein
MTSMSDLLSTANGYFRSFNDLVNGGLSSLPGTLGNVLNGILGGQTGTNIQSLFANFQGLLNLVRQTLSLPQQVQGWWEQFNGILKNEIDPCLQEPSINSFTFEPGWCLGLLRPTSSGKTQNPNWILDDRREVAAGRQDLQTPTSTDRDFDPSSDKVTMHDLIARSAEGMPMGRPDPLKLDQYMTLATENPDNNTDAFTLNLYASKPENRRRMRRGMAGLIVQERLGEVGQEQDQQKAEGDFALLANSAALLQGANNARSTQELLKKHLLPLSGYNMATTLATSQELREVRNLGAYNLQMQQSISETLDSLDKRQRNQNTRSIGLIFRSTSQIRNQGLY